LKKARASKKQERLSQLFYVIRFSKNREVKILTSSDTLSVVSHIDGTNANVMGKPL